MKVKKYPQLIVVSERDAQDFQDRLNDIFSELSESKIEFTKQMTIKPDGFAAIIEYEVVEKTPECLADEWELRGILPACSDCPYYEEINTRMGTCPYIQRGTLKPNDRVGKCKAYWKYAEEQEELLKGKNSPYPLLRTEILKKNKNYAEFCMKNNKDNHYFSNKINGKFRFTDGDKLWILQALEIEVTQQNIDRYFEA